MSVQTRTRITRQTEASPLLVGPWFKVPWDPGLRSLGPWFKVRLGSLGGRLLGEAGHLGERRALAVAVRATVAHEDECAAGAAQHDAQTALVEEPAGLGLDE